MMIMICASDDSDYAADLEESYTAFADLLFQAQSELKKFKELKMTLLKDCLSLSTSIGVGLNLRPILPSVNPSVERVLWLSSLTTESDLILVMSFLGRGRWPPSSAAAGKAKTTKRRQSPNDNRKARSNKRSKSECRSHDGDDARSMEFDDDDASDDDDFVVSD